MTDRGHLWRDLATEADREAALARPCSFEANFGRAYALLCRAEAMRAAAQEARDAEFYRWLASTVIR